MDRVRKRGRLYTSILKFCASGRKPFQPQALNQDIGVDQSKSRVLGRSTLGTSELDDLVFFTRYCLIKSPLQEPRHYQEADTSMENMYNNVYLITRI